MGVIALMPYGMRFSNIHSAYFVLAKTAYAILFGNRVLRISVLKRDKVTREWRKLYNAELHDLYSSHNIVRVIRSRRIKWTEHVAQNGGAERHLYGFGGET
jgi:hypothetical protein